MKTWKELREWFDAAYLVPRRETNAETVQVVEISLRHFERACNPNLLSAINRKTFKRFIDKRKAERVADATIGKDLDHVRLAFNFAVKKGVLDKCPDVPSVENEKRPITKITPEHFKAIFDACPDDWWRAFLATAVCTRFFVKELFSLRWANIDLETGAVELPPRKGAGRRRPKKAMLHQLAIKYLRELRKLDQSGKLPVFTVGASDKLRYTMTTAFLAMQKQAGVTVACGRDHKHSRLCGHYGLDDLRSAGTLHRGDELLDRTSESARQRAMREATEDAETKKALEAIIEERANRLAQEMVKSTRHG